MRRGNEPPRQEGRPAAPRRRRPSDIANRRNERGEPQVSVGRPRRDPATYVPPEENPALEQARNVAEWLVIILVAVLAALAVKTFALQAFYIPSESMEPTLHGCDGCNNDRVLVNKLAYRLGDIDRGDIIVFENPRLSENPETKDLIKRVVGLPGETVESRDGAVFVDGRLLPEPYLPPGTPTDHLEPQTLGPDEVLVLGDNRTNSQDGRAFGPLDTDLIVGEAFVRVWPLDKVGPL